MRRSTLTLAMLISTAAAGALALGALARGGAEAPEAADPWGLLGEIVVDDVLVEGEWVAHKSFPDALADQAAFVIKGYVVPVTPQPYLEVFLLVADPADCPFCGSGGYGRSLEVTMRRALPDLPEGTPIALRGTLDLIESPETYQSVRLVDAVPLGDVGR